MATPPDLSCHKERSNYLRLCRAIIDLGTQVLRNILSQWVQPNDVQKEVLNAPRLKSKLNLTQKQMLNTAASHGYSEFDISFLYALIRGLCTHIRPTKGWNPSYPPTSSEVTLGDDVERIRFIRNYVYGHMAETIIPDHAFEQHWRELEDVMDRTDAINGSQYKQSLLKIEADSMDSETLKLKTISDLQEIIITQWKEDDEVFCSTNASECVMNKVLSTTFTTITGAPGAGKSTIAHHAALMLQGMDYQIVPVDSVDEVIKFWVPGLKQAFVLDDVFGVHSIDEQELGNWNKKMKKMQICLKKNKLIITMRNQMYVDERISTLCSDLQHQCIDIGEQELMLSENEKENIFMKHLFNNQKECTLTDDVKKCNILCFPLMCQIFAADHENKLELSSFFKYPVEILRKQICLLKQNTALKYLGLVLCAVYDDKFPKQLLDVQDEIEDNKTRREDFAECCGLDRYVSRQSIHSHLQSLQGTYIFQEGDNYRFMHDIMYDVVVSTLTPVFHISLLTHCSAKFINQRVRFTSMDINDKQAVVAMDDTKQALWIKRLCKDVHDRKYFDVCSNVCLQNATREKIFASELESVCSLKDEDVLTMIVDRNTEHEIADEESEDLLRRFKKNYFYSIDVSLMHIIVHYNLEETFLFFLQYLFSNSGKKKLIFPVTLLNVAILSDNMSAVKILIHGYVDINEKGQDAASYTGHGKVAQILTDINECDNDGFSPLYVASFNGHDKVVQMLIDKGADINKCDNDGWSPLCAASQNGHDKVVKKLADKVADINKGDNDGWSPLCAASEKGHDKVVKILIERGADINKCDDDSWSPLCTASENGHDKVVQILTDKGADINYCDSDGWSPLCAAALNGHDEVVQILTDKGADINKCDNDGWNPLYAASYNGHEKVVRILIDKGADVNICNNDGWSPLYITLQNGHTNVARILTDKGADINKRHTGVSAI